MKREKKKYQKETKRSNIRMNVPNGGKNSIILSNDCMISSDCKDVENTGSEFFLSMKGRYENYIV